MHQSTKGNDMNLFDGKKRQGINRKTPHSIVIISQRSFLLIKFG